MCEIVAVRRGEHQCGDVPPGGPHEAVVVAVGGRAFERQTDNAAE